MASRIIVIAFLITLPCLAGAQSATTEGLKKKYGDAFELFFYNNTLRMLNQREDKDFDELIKDIEKMRLLMIKKNDVAFGGSEYKKLVAAYKAEAFEEIMTSRYDGKNFDVFLKEKDGKTKGMLVLVNDTDNLYILDILGRIALDKVNKLYQTLNEASDIGEKIRAFSQEGDDEKDGDKNH